MAVQSGPSVGSSGGYQYEDERGDGWVVFAGVLLLLLGIFNTPSTSWPSTAWWPTASGSRADHLTRA